MTVLPLHPSAEAAEHLLAENERLKRQLQLRISRELIGNSPAVQALRERLAEVAEQDAPLLIQGEAGTGKNLVAQTLHLSSPRAHRPFTKLDCAILSAKRLERELFAPRVGAGRSGPAASLSCSRVEAGAGGTLFLDNIDAVALSTQKRLVPVLEGQAPLLSGTNDARPFDVRVTAATHADLAGLVREGLFHEDLFHTLASQTLTVPPLRDCRGDVGLLTEHFVNCLAVKEGRPPKRLAFDALELLERYDWPGNVRELHNVIERACALATGPRLTSELIRPWLAGDVGEAPDLTLKDMERKLIETTFARYGGNRERTARALSIGLRTLSGKLREYGYPPRGGPGSNVSSTQRRAA